MNFLKIIGALTSKPYSFLARPWELKQADGLDIFDPLGNNLIVSIHHNSIIRITSKVNPLLNSEWITDRTRYFYDGLQKNRAILKLRCNTSALTWSQALSKLNTYKYLKENKLKFVINKIIDVRGSFFFKQFIALSCSTDFIIEKERKIILDLRNQYCFQNLFLYFEVIDNLILSDINPRVNFPTLNLKIIQKIKNKLNFKVAIQGSFTNLTYIFIYFGNFIKNTINLIEGKNLISNFFTKNNRKTLILSGLRRTIPFLNFFKNLKTGALIFYSYSSRFQEISFNEIYGSLHKFKMLNIFRNYDNFVIGNDSKLCLVENPVCVVTTHKNNLHSSLILATTSFLESNEIFVNFLGIFQIMKRGTFEGQNKTFKSISIIFKSFLIISSYIFNIYKTHLYLKTGTFKHQYMYSDLYNVTPLIEYQNKIQEFYQFNETLKNSKTLSLVTSKNLEEELIFK
jgi:hypothetical protein